MNSFCVGHANDFSHLTLDLQGFEGEYDLGFKFEERESDRPRAEPLLVLYVSVVQRASPRPLPTLRYGLTRSKFTGGLTSNPKDKERLLEMARPNVRRDVVTLTNGGTPESVRDVVML